MADEKEVDVPDEVADASTRIRVTARWLTVTFGAVAAALLTGLQLTGLSDVTGHDRTLALVGYGLGIGGVLIAILAASIVMTAGGVTLHELARSDPPQDIYPDLDERPDLYPGYDSVGDLARAIEQATAEQGATLRAVTAAPTNDNETAFANAVARMDGLLLLWDRLLPAAQYERLQHRWACARVAIIAGAALGAGGIAMFAVHVQTPDPAKPAIAQTPVAALATLTPKGFEAHKAQLGAGCTREDVGAIVTASDATGWTLMVVPTAGNACGPATIALKSSEGSVVASERVALEP